MALTEEQIAQLQKEAAEAKELRERIEAIDGNKKQILDEHAKNKQRLRELEEAEKERERKKLEQDGKLKELLEAARKDAEEARKEAEEARKAGEQLAAQQIQERIRSDFMAAAAPEVFRPDHLWPLFREATANKDGKTLVTYKGSEVSPAELVKRLRTDADFAHHFRPKGAGGMGAPASGGKLPAGDGSNPFLTGNVTAQINMQVEDPEQAAKLKAEAQAALAAQARR